MLASDLIYGLDLQVVVDLLSRHLFSRGSVIGLELVIGPTRGLINFLCLPTFVT